MPPWLTQYLNDLHTWTPALIAGIEATLLITFASMALSMVIGLLVSIARLAKPGPWYRPVHWVLRAYVETLRGVPMIVTLFILFFGLPAIGFTISKNPLVVGIAGLSVSLGAYMSEVFRAAILSVDAGQMEGTSGSCRIWPDVKYWPDTVGERPRHAYSTARAATRDHGGRAGST